MSNLSILDIQEHSFRALREKLYEVTVGITDRPAYGGSIITRRSTIQPVKDIYPCQRYILEDELYKVRDLNYLLQEKNFDMFNLEGYLTLNLEDDKGEFEIDLLPPIIEETRMPNGQKYDLICDGMHRIYLSMLEHRILNFVYITELGMLNHTPAYYAFPIPDLCGLDSPAWEEVKIYPGSKVPDGVIKRWPRIQNHKSSYRNFNSVFKGVSGRHTK